MGALVEVTDVGADHHCTTPKRLDLMGNTGEIGLVASGQCHVGAGRGVGEGDSLTDPVACAGDDCHLAREAECFQSGHLRFSCVA